MIFQLEAREVGSYTNSDLSLQVAPTLPPSIVLPGFEDLGPINPGGKLLEIPFQTPVIEFANGVLEADLNRSVQMGRLERAATFINDRYLADHPDLQIPRNDKAEIRRRMEFLRGITPDLFPGSPFPDVRGLMEDYSAYETELSDMLRTFRTGEGMVTVSYREGEEYEINDVVTLHVMDGRLALVGVHNIGLRGRIGIDEVIVTPRDDMMLTIVSSHQDEVTHQRIRYSHEDPETVVLSGNDFPYIKEILPEDRRDLRIDDAVSAVLFPNLEDVAASVIATYARLH